ncbi:MAG: TonB-dependent receptor [Verrucomicrobia bacterium]|nr:MAG: TonB-dependent receptor [Verrucomicrobiota bacterium]
MPLLTPFRLPHLWVVLCALMLLGLGGTISSAAPVSDQALSAAGVVVMSPLVVTATRSPQDPATVPIVTEVFSASDLRASPSLTLDDALRRSAAFSLFRRSGSLTANPTAQGVSLRGIGPSGASRALVLLDGIPVNDPFGGWVAWTKLPRNQLDRVEVVRGGGSAAWGGSTLGGVVQVLSAPIFASKNGGTLTGTIGDFGTRGIDLSGSATSDRARDGFRIEAAAFATDGVGLVRAPGPIDRPADSEYQRASLSWAHRVTDTVTLTSSLRFWSEARGNGTPYQRNASDAVLGSAILEGKPAAGNPSAWSLTLYAQTQDFSSTFSAVNAARTVETPATDQYSVPATAAGASLQMTWGDSAALSDRAATSSNAVTTLGVDARRVDGETREFFFYTSGAFANERRTGGALAVAGVFASHVRPLAAGLTATFGARLDATQRPEGFRAERALSTGALTLQETYPDRHDIDFSPSAGMAWRATEAFTVRAAAYAAYRTPTLNELYRPFRIGNTTTRANPALRAEALLGGELSIEYTATHRRFGMRASAFKNELDDAVANVTTLVNASGITRERRNLDSTRIGGFELGGFFAPTVLPALRFDADYLLSDARVRAGGAGGDMLDGKALAQVPRHTLSLGAAWQATSAASVDLRARWFSAQFEDDLNTLELASGGRLDAAVRYSLSPRWSLQVAVENLLDSEIEIARTAAGLVSIAPPRFARATFSYGW